MSFLARVLSLLCCLASTSGALLYGNEFAQDDHLVSQVDSVFEQGPVKTVEPAWFTKPAATDESTQRPQFGFEETVDDAGEPAGTMQLVQYPFEASASQAIEPEEQLEKSISGPLGHLRKQIDSIPGDQKGFVFSDRTATMTVVPGGGNESLFLSTLDLRLTGNFKQLPFIRITPRFGWTVTDYDRPWYVPENLIDAGVNFTVFAPMGPRWNLMMFLSPSVFTDGDNLSADAFRLTGGGMGFYQWTESTKLIVGFIYLGREDILALPAVGLIYSPHDDFKAEISFPRPKVAWRVSESETQELWTYIAGELGGSSWAVDLPNGQQDMFTYKDLRLIGGIEQTCKKSARWVVEGGVVFERKFEYDSGFKRRPSPSGVLRASFVF
ncbi:DUF6268 family outer membrane beta-barrel protein [Planctomicrobium sp. SH527]|uniref:DUF6268 family outer membrane beta-barrel protein n=1 Tax=Planctomicrobium sp. SH527 TaxID=3448123 RepID=UPI003F5B83C0